MARSDLLGLLGQQCLFDLLGQWDLLDQQCLFDLLGRWDLSDQRHLMLHQSARSDPSALGFLPYLLDLSDPSAR